jgi:hypothetical protein
MDPITLVLGAVSAVGTAKSISAQKKSTALQQRQVELQASRERRQAIREAQIRRAQGRATAEAAGVGSSSLVGGGMASIGSQLGGTLGYASQQSGLSAGVTRLNQQSQFWGGVAGLAAGGFNQRDGWAQVGDFFKGMK